MWCAAVAFCVLLAAPRALRLVSFRELWGNGVYAPLDRGALRERVGRREKSRRGTQGATVFALVCIVLKVPRVENPNRAVFQRNTPHTQASSPSPNSRPSSSSRPRTPRSRLLLALGVEYTKFNRVGRFVTGRDGVNGLGAKEESCCWVDEAASPPRRVSISRRLLFAFHLALRLFDRSANAAIIWSARFLFLGAFGAFLCLLPSFLRTPRPSPLILPLPASFPFLPPLSIVILLPLQPARLTYSHPSYRLFNLLTQQKEASGVTALATVCIIVLTSVVPMRRWWYNVFLGVHGDRVAHGDAIARDVDGLHTAHGWA
ncbi:hypothetical protein B0H13DRAFT_1916036 [Mycena leptocephala]|nr:hypothetical protein B0H13DRAFT_1916036 [Mycena leptocephala]